VQARQLGWPRLRQLDLGAAWQWARRFDGFTSGFSNSAISRALNALTLAMDRQIDPLIGLLWSMVGVEALYNRRGVPIMEQLREKCTVLLGASPTNRSIRKIFGDIYAFRSSFVHGGSDFAGLNLLHDGLEAAERHREALWHTTPMSLAILVASLQELMHRNMTALEFDYTIRST
jgi:hypothetical protein